MSVLLGFLTVWGTFLLARELFPERPGVALTGAALLALLPSFLFISAVVNNDNLIIVLSTFTLLCWTRILKGAGGWRQGVYLGGLLGMAALAKMPGLILWGVSGVGFALLALPRTGRGAWVRMGTTCFGVAVLLYAPWLVFNAVAYSDPLAWSRFLRVTPRTEAFSWAEGQRYAVGMLSSLGGRYGGASQISLPDIAYVGLAAVCLVGILGLGGLARTWRRGRLEGWLRHSLLLCALFVVVLLLAHIRLMTFILGMVQARHVFAGLPVVVILLAFGLHWLGAKRRWLAAVVVALTSLVSLTALWSVKDAYRQDALPPSLSPPVGHVAVSAAFGDGMHLDDTWVEPGPLAAGGTLSVVARWRAIAAPGGEYWLQVQLTGPDGRSDVVAVRDGVPAGGRVTSDRWRQGDVFESRHTLSLPASLPPGGYEVSVGLHSNGTWDWLPSAGRNQVLVGSVEIGGAP
ncbi:MAG: glycosyltransferase family 39 protein [Chloroflexota bacterium]|nr:glycosyltransferase family 39 protein [Chloroflexota bacterium]